MPHDDRKGRHYYTRKPRPVKPEYSSDDPCGRHGEWSGRHEAGAAWEVDQH